MEMYVVQNGKLEKQGTVIATRACEASSVSWEFVPEEQVIAIGIGSGNFFPFSGSRKGDAGLIFEIFCNRHQKLPREY